jgi:hypothetical protein
MTLGEFKALLRTTLKRGTQFDTILQQQISMALTKMERNYTYLYMEQFRLLQVEIGQRIIDLPPNLLVKNIKMIRWINSDGSYTKLEKTEPGQMAGLVSGVPYRYFLSGQSQIVFDATPTTQLVGEAILVQYSQLSSDETTEPRVLQIAPDVLLMETLRLFATVLRDPRMLDMQNILVEEGRNTLTRAEDEGRFSDANLSLVYSPQPSGNLVGYTEDVGR